MNTKLTLGIVAVVALAAIGYFAFMQPVSAPTTENTGDTPQGKIDINAICEGALAYMSFPSGAEAEVFVQECKEGKHPEVIEQWKRDNNFPDTSAMRAEENMVVVTEQRPGNTVTASQVHLAARGFIVIHEDTDGTPGAIIGSSSLLQAGDSAQIKVTLSRSVRDGEKLHAMLHSDTDGNGTFSASIDQPVMSRLGGPLEGWFEISAEASANPAITI